MWIVIWTAVGKPGGEHSGGGPHEFVVVRKDIAIGIERLVAVKLAITQNRIDQKIPTHLGASAIGGGFSWKLADEPR